MDEQIQRAVTAAREARMHGMKVNAEAAALDRFAFQQKRIVILLLQGFECKEIAAKYRISEKTVRNHLTHIYMKADVDNRPGLFLWAVYHGVLVLDMAAAKETKQYACPGCEQPLKLRKRDGQGLQWAGTCTCGTYLQIEFPQAA